MYNYPYKICDPIHGFIRFDDIEKKLINNPFYQRLRFIRQMGICSLVYPGANHTRFEHCLGVMDISSRIYETLIAKHNLDPLYSHMIPASQEERTYWRRILRLAALCHDLGHLPFSHTAEPDLFPKGGHERMTHKIIRSEPLRTIWRMIPSQGRSVEEDILKLSVHENELKEFDPKITLAPWEKVLSQVITDDNYGADRMDYLIRDAQCTGVSYGQFEYNQLIDTLRILPSHKDSNLLTIGVTSSGIQSVESLWIARYHMSARVYQLSKPRIFAYHMRQFMTDHYANSGFPNTLQGYLKETDDTIITAIFEAASKNDYHARTLLRQERGFREIPLDQNLEKTVLEKKMDLEKQYNKDIFIDYDPEEIEAEHFRQFPVLDGSQVMLSSEVSPFLRDIPLSYKLLRVFVHPSKFDQIKETIHSYQLTSV